MLEITHLTKTYHGAPLLRDLSFAVHPGEIVCLLGPSGGGKTTLLRIIAGLEAAERGDVFFDGKNLRAVPTHARGFGMMFQDLALFPHKNVFENIAFGLRMQNCAPAEVRARVNETLALVGLGEFAARDVTHLSGGEQQRVALARALAPRPRLLMLDEPLGALDRILREQLIGDLRAILKRIGAQQATLYVTHDQDEAFAIADRIAILHDGRIVQIGAPAEIYRAPANVFVARFLGMTNLIRAHMRADARAETELGIFAATAQPTPSNKTLWALIRPAWIHLATSEPALAATVTDCSFRAGEFRVRVVTAREIPLTFSSAHALPVGARIALAIDRVEMLNAD